MGRLQTNSTIDLSDGAIGYFVGYGLGRFLARYGKWLILGLLVIAVAIILLDASGYIALNWYRLQFELLKLQNGLRTGVAWSGFGQIVTNNLALVLGFLLGFWRGMMGRPLLWVTQRPVQK